MADFNYVPIQSGFVYVSFITDLFSRYIVSWKASLNMRTSLVLDALEQAIYERHPNGDKSLVHHSDQGSQYLSLSYSERLKSAGITPLVGTMGDALDNALAETINALYKAEVIHRKARWQSLKEVELATLEWVFWFNHERLLSSIGYTNPAAMEEKYYQTLAESN